MVEIQNQKMKIIITTIREEYLWFTKGKGLGLEKRVTYIKHEHTIRDNI